MRGSNKTKGCRGALLLLGSLAILLAFAGCGQNPAIEKSERSELPTGRNYFIFDTLVSVRVYDEEITDSHFEEIQRLLLTIDAGMNRQREDSELSEVNRQAGQAAVEVSEQTFHVVKTAMDYAAASGGKFEPAIGPLVDLWGIGKEGAQLPSPAAIEGVLALIDYRQVEWNEGRQTIKLLSPGMSLDLGAIAKGYAGDVVASYLKEHGFDSAIIDVGGNIIAMGDKPGGNLWTIGIQDPGEKRGEHIGRIRVMDKTIVTSGVYERYFIQDGIHYHHIFDPNSGYPVNNGLLSVTIVTDRSIDADALSTTVFAMGLQQGTKFIEDLDNTEAIFITEDRLVYATSGLTNQLQLTDASYQLAQ